MNYLLAIDQGTSSTRAMLYTKTGELIASCQYALKQSYPKPGWAELDAEEIWQKTLSAVQDVVSRVDVKKISACGITNQRETTLLWDKQTGNCLAPAIVWQDRRTQAFCHSLEEYAKTIHKKTGLLPDPYFSASKINWLLQNIPEAQALVLKNQLAFGTVDSFLLWRLTKGQSHLTDVTNASRTMLFNLFKQEWDNELLEIFQIPSSILPEVMANDAHFGFIDKSYFGMAIPITAMVGDQQAALIGQYCFSKGMIKATYGTGGFLIMNTGSRPILSQHKLLTTVAYRVKNQTAYGLEGSLYQAGSIIKWLRDELKIINSAEETEALARSLSSNEGVYLVPAFTGLGAPHWISSAGAILIGLALNTSRAHFARAALECVCYQTREIIACMREDSNIDVSLLRIDGGMAKNDWFTQFLSSQCDLTVERPIDTETTARGAAILAAVGCEIVSSLDILEFGSREQRIFLPANQARVDKDYYHWKKALKKLTAN